MYTKFLYYGKNADDRILIGARMVFESSDGIKTQEVYIGSAFTLEEFLLQKDNLNIKSDTNFIKENFFKSKADKIIYFSNLKKFGFINGDDIVVNNKSELLYLIDSFASKDTFSRKKVNKKDN